MRAATTTTTTRVTLALRATLVAALAASCARERPTDEVVARRSSNLLFSQAPGSLSAEFNHTCAVLSDATVVCWGYNRRGEIGAPADIVFSSAAPLHVPGLTDVVSVTTGRFHSCAALSDGTAHCWGDNEDGQLGTGSADPIGTSSPVTVGGLTGVVSLAGGAIHTCALLNDGTVRCWGRAENGQTGGGPGGTHALVPVTVVGLTNAVAIAAGNFHSCALLADHTVRCWGSGGGGQLGIGFVQGAGVDTPQPIGGLTNVVAIGCGVVHTCALLDDGTAACWGYNAYGQLGVGDFDNRGTPQPVVGVSEGTALAVGDWGTCVRLADGRAKCWGYNELGQLGDGTEINQPSPVDVVGVTDVADLAIAETHTCARFGNGGIRCWGFNNLGQLGDSSLAAPSPPGSSCTNGTTCSTGICVDGVCCESACGGGDPGDCQACGADGICALLPSTHVCRAADGPCDVDDSCTGASAACPTTFAPLGTVCAPATADTCQLECTGGGPSSCNIHFQEGLCHPVAVGSGVVTPLNGGIDALGGMQLSFSRVTAPGEATVIGARRRSSGGLDVLSGPMLVNGWNIIVTATYEGSPVFCVHYDPTTLPPGGVAALRMEHNGVDVTTSTPPGKPDVVCGQLTPEPTDPGPPDPDGGVDADAEGGAPVLAQLGDPCSDPSVCASNFCSDGVCCASDCGGGAVNDCQACSISKGGSVDGQCMPVAATMSCGPAPTAGMCLAQGACGGGAQCPGPKAITSCTTTDVPGCAATTCEQTIAIPGPGARGIHHIEVTFKGPLGAGHISANPCATSVPAPTNGYQIVSNPSNGNELACLDIEVSPNVYSGANTLTVCIYYTEDIVGAYDEGDFRVLHYDRGGWVLLEGETSVSGNKLCGDVQTLSPFAIGVPIDTTPPVLVNVPGPIVAYATSTAGAKVTYATPSAVDDLDGARDVSCSPASGSTFHLGQSTINCTAVDNFGNVGSAAIPVWVKVQAPTDGSSFLPPINADGSSIFKVGSTVPVKVKLTGASAAIANLTATLSVVKVSNGVSGNDLESTSTAAGDAGDLFRYDAGTHQYIFNLSTKPLSAGTWSIRAELGDGVVHKVNVSLRAK